LPDPILQNIPVSPAEKALTKAYIINQDGLISASQKEQRMGDRINLPDFDRVLGSTKGLSRYDEPLAIACG